MKPSPYAPRRHLFVCTHRRPEGDPLGMGCAERGENMFEALRARVRQLRAFDVWVTRTGCMGVCPTLGCTVASNDSQRLLCEVTEVDAAQIVTQT